MTGKSELLQNKRILIIHFRVGKTDGVSLEITSWKEILERAGADVKLCAGPHSIGADYIIDNLEQQLNPIMYRIDDNAFGRIKDFKSESELINKIKEQDKILKKELDSLFLNVNPDYIIISNIFSVGEGLPIAPALTKSLDSNRFRTIAINHDFYWENERYKKPTTSYVEEILEKYFPPKRDYIKHYCINSIGQETLWLKKGIKADLLFDTFDFRQKKWQKKKSTSKYLEKKGIKENDIIFLQATRVVKRKNIEISIDLINEIYNTNNLRNLEKRGLYDGREFNSNKDKIKLVLSGYVEKRDRPYLKRLIKYANRKNIVLTYLGDGIDKEYCFWDIYPYADIITYPSEYEGFGNQVLEALFARKPIVLFEYPVFKVNIKPKGFSVISLGDKLDKNKVTGLKRIPRNQLRSAAGEVVEILTNSTEYKRTVKENYLLGNRYFSHASRIANTETDLYNGIIEKNYELGAKNFSYENTFEVLQKVLC